MSVILADLNLDGKLDVVVPDAYANTVSVLSGSGDGTFLPRTDYAVAISPEALASADLNGQMAGRI